MSQHVAEVFQVTEVAPWPNSDNLELIRFRGYETAALKGQFAPGDSAVFIQPDTLVPVSDPQFSFLAKEAKSDGYARVKAKRLRGSVSQGLLVKTDLALGTDVWDSLALRHYEPEEEETDVKVKGSFTMGGEEEAGPDFDTGPVKYDLENVERFPNLFARGELVELSEKVDGTNVRFTYWQGRFWVKSRNRWVKRVPDYSHVSREFLQSKGLEGEKIDKVLEATALKGTNGRGVNSLWKLLEANERLMKYLQDNERTVVFGEGWGRIGRLKYSLKDNTFSVFDVYRESRWLDRIQWDDVPLQYSVPEVARIHYALDMVKTFASGPSKLSALPPFREGIVLKPVVGRGVDFGKHFGRLILKAKNPDYHAMR